LSDYLQQLNEAQRKAVLHKNGPSMVIAGAGSGKTRVLTYRIAHLLYNGVDAFNILSLTFTNKAAREMRERISKLVGESEAKNLWMGTFHSIFARILRIEGSRLGYPNNFTIYDAEDARKVVAQIIKERSLDKDIYKPKMISGRISSLKNNLITPKVYFNSPELIEQDESARIPLMGELYAAYTERCFRAGAMDFDDLLLKTNELLYKFPEVLAKYQERFKYILVDEYQDTNHSQYLIVKSLAGKYENICVVGDDAQSIYAFRGANIRNILNFQKDYADATVYKLEQNYRSTKNIVNAANSIISKNRDQLEKDVWTDNTAGDRIIVHKAISDTDEGNYAAQNIFEVHMNERAQYSDFAILYRTNAQSRSFEDALRRRNIPYRIYGGLSFYQRKEIKDFMAYLRLAVNPKDEEAFRRVINYPMRGIGATTVAKITIAANENDKSLWEIAENIQFYNTHINRGAQHKISDFVTMIKSYQVMAEKQDAFHVAEHVAKTAGVVRLLGEDKTPEGVSRYENVQELLNGLKDFSEQQQQLDEGNPSLAAYLQDVALITDQDTDDPNDTNKVALMTIHLAKGLEFPYVFIGGLEENLFPNMMALGSRTDLEEERRLFYVALTRAEKKAFLTFAHTRYRWGKLIDCEPSRFIEEIDEKYLDMKVPDFSPFTHTSEELNRAFGPPQTKRKAVSKTQSPPPKHKPAGLTRKNLRKMDDSTSGDASHIAGQLEEGSRVIHDRFGMGVVSSIEGEGADQKATIAFENAGEKKLLLKFAKLRIMSK
jgi:DNA helicase-2/ATP-dependent DNA helicase PcrA